MTGLPAQVSSFVGRSRELADLHQLYADSRLITLTGPGGSGKTRLALEFAAALQHAGGRVHFVDLAPVTDAARLPASIAAAVGVREHSGEPIEQALAQRYAERDITLVLDNLEQVEGAGAAVAAMLAGAPGLRIVATSRAALHVRGDHEYPVGPLALPGGDLGPADDLAGIEAVALFVERAAAIDPGFALTADNAPAVAQICRRLDGLPLAIELAAAQTRLFAPAALLRRLDRPLPLLVGGPADAPTRQRTLASAIGWSFELLSASDQRVFARLSVFAGGFSLTAAEAVAGGWPEPEGDLLGALGRLVDQNLLRVSPNSDDEPRFRLLETIREFAWGQVADVERDQLRDRHLAHFLALAEQGEAELRGPDQALWLRRIVAERSDVLAALDWARASGDTESMVRLVAALKKRFWYASGGLRTGLDWLEVAVQAGSQVPRLRAKVLQRAAWFAWELGLRERSRTLFEQSLATADESDHDSRVEALMGLCYHELRQPSPDLDRVEARLQDALREAQRTGKLGDLVEPLSTAGFLAELRGDQALARQHFEEAVAVARKCDDAWAIGTALFRLAGLDLAVGDVEQAMSRLADSAELSAQSGDLELYSRATLHLAQLETDRGALADARAHLLGGAAAARDIGTSWEQQLVLDAAALWLVAVGSTPDWGDSVGGRGLAEAAAAAVEAVEAVELTDLPAPAALRERFRLTDREWEVLALVAAGRSDGEIADQLVISKKTASVHVANIKGKLGAASRVEVATIALRAGVG